MYKSTEKNNSYFVRACVHVCVCVCVCVCAYHNVRLCMVTYWIVVEEEIHLLQGKIKGIIIGIPSMVDH